MFFLRLGQVAANDPRYYSRRNVTGTITDSVALSEGIPQAGTITTESQPNIIPQGLDPSEQHPEDVTVKYPVKSVQIICKSIEKQRQYRFAEHSRTVFQTFDNDTTL